MSKLTLLPVDQAENLTTLVQTINANNTAIVSAFEKLFNRDGLVPNEMEYSLDMNSKRILNLPAPILPTEPLRKGDITTLYVTGTADAYALAQAVETELNELTDATPLDCNPSAGDNFQLFCHRAAARKPTVTDPSTQKYLRIANGYHTLPDTMFVDINDNYVLDIRSTGLNDSLIMTSLTYVNDGVGTGPVDPDVPRGFFYTATIGLDPTTPMPLHVVPGYALKCDNVTGTEGADALTGAHKVVSVALNRLSFTVKFRSFGVSLPSSVTLASTPSLGVTPNRVIVPLCCLAVSPGVAPNWDGGAREGFFNAISGGRIKLTNIAIAYTGTVETDHDILFARDNGSEIKGLNCAFAGAGEMVTRSFGMGQIMMANCGLGGGLTGVNIFQGSGGGSASFSRCSMNSVRGDAISCSSGSTIQIGLTTITGCNQALRSTYPDSSVDMTGGRITYVTNALAPTKGYVSVDTNTTIRYCIYPFSLSGGIAYGNPILTSNTNIAPSPYIENDKGSYWLPENQPLNDGSFEFPVPSLTFGVVPAQSFVDVQVTAPGAKFGDYCFYSRNNSPIPNQTFIISAFVSVTDNPNALPTPIVGQVTLRCHNYSTSSITVTGHTGRILGLRGSIVVA